MLAELEEILRTGEPAVITGPRDELFAFVDEVREYFPSIECWTLWAIGSKASCYTEGRR
jgi:hypothetical protein